MLTVRDRLPTWGLGSAALGGLYHDLGEQNAVATLHAALDAGIRYIDTAPFYGFGAAEQRVGETLAARPTPGLLVSTKVGRLIEAAPDEASPHAIPGRAWFDLSAAGLHRSLEQSLERLGLDRVDLLYLHDPDDHLEQAKSEALPVLRRLRDEGIVDAIGIGMNHAGRLAELVAQGDVDAVLCAGRYTLLDQSALDELFPVCHQQGTAIVLGGVLNSGILANPRPGAPYDYRDAPAAVAARAQALSRRCATFGTTLLTAAITFAARPPAVTTVLLGARNPEELRTSLEATITTVPTELWEALVADGLTDPRTLEAAE